MHASMFGLACVRLVVISTGLTVVDSEGRGRGLICRVKVMGSFQASLLLSTPSFPSLGSFRSAMGSVVWRTHTLIPGSAESIFGILGGEAIRIVRLQRSATYVVDLTSGGAEDGDRNGWQTQIRQSRTAAGIIQVKIWDSQLPYVALIKYVTRKASF